MYVVLFFMWLQMCVCVFDGCTLSIGMTVLYYTVGPKTGYSAFILQMSTDLDEI